MTKKDYLALMEQKLAVLPRGLRFDALDKWEGKLNARFPDDEAEVMGMPDPEDAAKMEIEAVPPLRRFDGWLTKSSDDRLSLATRILSMPLWWVAATVLGVVLSVCIIVLWIVLAAVKTLRFILRCAAVLCVPLAVAAWFFVSHGLGVALAGAAVILFGLSVIFGAVKDRSEDLVKDAIEKTVRFSLSLFRKEDEV